MSELPRFENVDLTPTWDDVDPAELDFGGGALDPEPVAAGFDTGAAVEVEEPDVEESEAELDLPPELDQVDEGEDADEIDVEAELAEAPVAAPVEDEPADEFAGLDDADMQFGDGPIGADTVPDDFDL